MDNHILALVNYKLSILSLLFLYFEIEVLE